MRLWIEPLDSNTARELPGTDGAHLPFWDGAGRGSERAGHRFLYWIVSTSPELTGMYGASLGDPQRRVRIMGGNSWAFPASARTSQYLVWVRGDSAVAQLFDPTSFKLTGSEVPLANPAGLFGNTPEISAAGDLLAYGPPLESEADWVDRGGKTLATSGGSLGQVSDPQLSPDGRRYALRGLGSVVITHVARNVSTRLAEGAGPFAWSPDGSEIAFSFGRNASGYSYDVAADRQRFLLIAPSSRRGHEPLSVIVNWPALLKRK